MKQLNISQKLYDYIIDVSLKAHPVLAELAEETSKHALAQMQTAPEQAQFMQFLLRLINAKKVLELGTFTGYGSLAMALALPEDGQLITCDINDDWTKGAHKYWQAAKQDHKIELRLGPALETIIMFIFGVLLIARGLYPFSHGAEWNLPSL
jgi:predicted O-methyltransferase YrrM